MSNISCIEFNRLIEQTIEARSSVDAGLLRAHATECAGCRAAWLDAVLLDGAVAEWRKTGKKILPSIDLADIVLCRRSGAIEPLVTADVTPFSLPATIDQEADKNDVDRVAATVRITATPATPTRTRPVRSVATTAVGLAAALSIAFFWMHAGHDRSELAVTTIPLREPTNRTSIPVNTPKVETAAISHPATQPSSPQRGATPASAAPVEVPVAAMVQGAQSAYFDLANDAARAVAGATALVPGPGLVSAATPVRDENDHWVDDVGQQFEPVGKNLSQAFQFMLEAVPAEKAPAT